ncbi:MAG: CDP-glycerol glycerophosphotransferase family protein [Blautia sp.]|nr:CDP-glycerol glycerophosphotransferase family protein [Blautia sp.]
MGIFGRAMRRVKKLRKVSLKARQRAEQKTRGSVGKERVTEFARAYTKEKLDQNLILYESFWGRGISDNPYAIFLTILQDPSMKRMKHVWALDDFENNAPVIKAFSSWRNVSFVKTHSREYIHVLARAKYLVNNVTFPDYFIKREGQIYINTWHGTPLKMMGYDVPDPICTTMHNTMRNFFCADYLIAANRKMTDMYLKSYRLEGLMPGKIIEEGYPRNDLLIRTKREEVIKKLADFGIQVEENKRIVLFAPTWREGNKETPQSLAAGFVSVRDKFAQAVNTQEYQLLIRPHQFVYQLLKDDPECRSFLIPSVLDANETLAISDLLISDYSSIFIDYLVTKRPILFYVPDAKQYQTDRGLSRGLDELPGPYSDDLDVLLGMLPSLDKVREKYAAQYERWREEFCSAEDGNSSKRVIDAIFKGKKDGRLIQSPANKKKLLISSGEILENGITHALLSLLRQIDYDKWDVTAFLIANIRKPEIASLLNSELDPRVRAVNRCGALCVTPEEEYARNMVLERPLDQNIRRRYYSEEIYAREWRRCFGDTSYDVIVDFNGYTLLFAPMLLCGRAKRKVIWMHNDIAAEMEKVVDGERIHEKRFQFLSALYPRFDAVVSCGKSVMEINRKNFSDKESYDRFLYAKNIMNTMRVRYCLDHSQIISLEGKEYLLTSQITGRDFGRRLSMVELPPKDGLSFVTLGRMSPEKNQLALVRAFAGFYAEYPQARLYIIGNGPMREEIEQEIIQNGLEQAVILTGSLADPFTLMSHCSCFILPSIHEGQPLVLLEARACGLPIIVSDFSTVKDSLYPNGQLLIHSDEESIREGLYAFARGQVPTCTFDMDTYNHEAYLEFLQAIEGRTECTKPR